MQRIRGRFIKRETLRQLRSSTGHHARTELVLPVMCAEGFRPDLQQLNA
jgi:hypothetical protein